MNLTNNPIQAPPQPPKINCILPPSENSQYLGNLLNNKKENFGIEKWNDNAKFIGIFHNNKANGYGMVTFSNKDNFKGEFIDGKANGYGMYTFFSMGGLSSSK